MSNPTAAQVQARRESVARRVAELTLLDVDTRIAAVHVDVADATRLHGGRSIEASDARLVLARIMRQRDVVAVVDRA